MQFQSEFSFRYFHCSKGTALAPLLFAAGVATVHTVGRKRLPNAAWSEENIRSLRPIPTPVAQPQRDWGPRTRALVSARARLRRVGMTMHLGVDVEIGLENSFSKSICSWAFVCQDVLTPQSCLVLKVY
jgi:hypothetical protein